MQLAGAEQPDWELASKLIAPCVHEYSAAAQYVECFAGLADASRGYLAESLPIAELPAAAASEHSSELVFEQTASVVQCVRSAESVVVQFAASAESVERQRVVQAALEMKRLAAPEYGTHSMCCRLMLRQVYYFARFLPLEQAYASPLRPALWQDR